MPSIGHGEVEVCLRVLAAAGAGTLDPELTARVERAAAEAYRDAKKRRKRTRSAEDRQHDQALLATARRFWDEIPAPTAPPASEERGMVSAVERSMLRRSRRCYVCKDSYREVDSDYHQLCPDCAQENTARRSARCDLRGRRALVTGGRVKIGFHTALKLLRDGADVLVTTRFPRDAARRYAELPDFDDWSDRLHLHGVDFLDLGAVLDLVSTTGKRWDSLDILINNAAQTLYRPPEFHRAVRAAEREGLSGRAARLELTTAAVAPAEPDPAHLPAALAALFPTGRTDETGQPLDLRPVNSWMLRDSEVTPQEWLQVQVVNAFVPFLLTSRLRPLLTASPHPDRYVVQVSAMEGSYSRRNKTARHPHTNMAKAALNMFTRTVADDYQRSGIHMNSVDTGWVTDERPHPGKTAQREAGFRPPLDMIDGAARVYDPIVRGVAGHPVHGQFLKDYRSVQW
ncbi:SDR family NAD(P)-dependent oxidoreductase [Micromonospora polyrhachis]|uniref:NAD(P)-dependent dehydrogenase (Short-subunit alcohol dehydrogenase family) n=1 Tax=Micromonospora polyrhachis TaxID=1282883 RepID=A0A7W7SWU8_9ACTN|nr:SDR family oxidoreductase [Micromonospora polyrhachis]MBB4962452.1 NAD(P)-dependent dehydrogenase (short-subunit alcohol dehydrogenase family) [Micromonospora polyrhachis]